MARKKSAKKKGLTPEAVLKIAERTKRAENEERVLRIGGTFTPLACSVYGTLGAESEQVLQVLAAKMKEKTEDSADAAARASHVELAPLRNRFKFVEVVQVRSKDLRGYR